MLMALLAGIVCAFVGSIPIAGPTAVIIIERALRGESRVAFEIAVGAAVAEAAYALCAYLGMTAFLSEFPWLLPASRLLGALILLGLGLYLALAPRRPAPSHEAEADEPAERRRFGGPVLLGLVVTGVNPTLLASWSAVVTVLHSTGGLRIRPLDGFPFAAGVAVGSVAWFALLLALLKKFRSRVSQTTLARVVRIMGWVLAVAGLALLVVVVRTWFRS